jgi:hypothetical protein
MAKFKNVATSKLTPTLICEFMGGMCRNGTIYCSVGRALGPSITDSQLKKLRKHLNLVRATVLAATKRTDEVIQFCKIVRIMTISQPKNVQLEIRGSPENMIVSTLEKASGAVLRCFSFQQRAVLLPHPLVIGETL